MARYSAETRRSPEKVLEKALAFFGPGGLGLTVEEQSDCCLRLTGGGGHVWIQIELGESGRTSVVLETREWDSQAMRFLKIL
ncbi:MAG: hypothetical protein H5T61_10900 [Thermoflexales bacterium]|nr:hypothetical protein [Thermoflexales bacterium]